MRVFRRETETECVYIYIDVGSIRKEKENKIGARRCENKKSVPTPNNPGCPCFSRRQQPRAIPFTQPHREQEERSMAKHSGKCAQGETCVFEAASRYPPYTCPHTCSHTQTCICACVKFRMGLSEQFRMSAKVIKCARAVRPLSLRFAREVCFSWRLLSFVFYLLLGLFVARTLPVTLHTVCVRHYTLYLSQPHPSAPVRESYTL